MANQPPPRARPLFRLASLTSPAPTPTPTPEVQPQPPAPQPRPPPARPAPPFRPPTAYDQPRPTQPQEPAPPPPTSPAPKAMLPVTSSSSVPSSPKPKNSASSSSLPTSRAPKAVPTSPTPKAAATTIRMPTPTQSPKIVKPSAETPPQSPKIKPPAPPPSFLILPPSQLKSNAEPGPKIPLHEVEQKNVLVQKTIERPKATLNGDSQSDVGDACKPTITKFSGSEEVGLRVITIAGENKGNPHGLHQKNNSGAKNDGNKWGSYSVISIDEGKPKMTDKTHQKLAMPSPTLSAFINSNVQGVNNSILHNCSCTHHDPGVHLALSRKPSGGRQN